MKWKTIYILQKFVMEKLPNKICYKIFQIYNQNHSNEITNLPIFAWLLFEFWFQYVNAHWIATISCTVLASSSVQSLPCNGNAPPISYYNFSHDYKGIYIYICMVAEL